MLEMEIMDPNVERFTKVEWQMSKLLQCYHEVYEAKEKMAKWTMLMGFFSKATPKHQLQYK